MTVFTETGEGEKMEEKKEYVAPEMKVVDMRYQQVALLYGSDCDENSDPGCGEMG